MVPLLWKTFGEFPKKLNISLPHSLVVQSSMSRNLHKRRKKPCAHKELYMNVHSTIIHNSLQLEAIQMPMNFKMWFISTIKCYSVIKKGRKH